jgi:hypothetical protein
MDKLAIAGVDADVRNTARGKFKEQQISTVDISECNPFGAPVLCLRGARNGYSGHAIGVIDQPAAVKSMRCGAAVPIR